MRNSLALAVFALSAVAVSPPPAHACMNGVERVVDVTNRSVRRAEALLADGAYQAAVKEALATFPEVLQLTHRARRAGLFARAQRVVALAAVRSGGRVRLGSNMSGKTDAKRAANLAWAAMLLRVHHARGGDDVVVQVELAEALAALPAERAEAHARLKELGEADLLPTARAWGLLAELERERGDVTAAERAGRRCREIAPEGQVCGPKPATA
ncbi:hypothetical protein [Nannocystis pusilla]|uniref:Uncharacterized protein n=1 Tax=Nannocystis pusilla TaxID=889268 RepID=A0ABS7TX42_9BACT|nr:hypothetical protein [Nannocystis pusilla]MBZ5712829.1 hypothetical protein [Nannocystis pusilla]